jgi:O-antigen ligase
MNMEESSVAAGSMSKTRTGMSAVRATYFAFVLLIPIETIDFFQTGGDTRVFSLSRLLGGLLFCLALIDRRRCFQKIPAAFWMVAWYIAAYTSSQLWVSRGLDAMFLKTQAILFYSIVLFLISANLFEDAGFRGAVLSFYGWWVSLVAIGMLLGVFGPPPLRLEGRSSILGQDPNSAAGFFALGAVCIAGDSLTSSSRRATARFLLALLAIAVLIMAIIQTGSRGGLLDIVAGILGLALCGVKATRKKRALIAGAVIGLLGILVLRELRQGTATATRLMDTWNQGDTAGRTEIYAAAWSMFREKPLLGYGGANNQYMLGTSLNYPVGGIFYRDTHNLLLAVLTEVGLIGAIPFIAAIFYALWKAWCYGRRTGNAMPFALMCVQIAINMSLTGSNQNLFWIVLAAAVACGMELDSASKRAIQQSVLTVD